MTQIEIICLGNRLHDTGEFSHESELIDAFEGDTCSDWHSIRKRPRHNHIARLQGDEYIPRSRYGERGRAEAARRFGQPTDEQQRLLDLPDRMNYNLPCDRCGDKLTRHWEDIQLALRRIAALAEDSSEAKRFGIEIQPNKPMRITLQQLRRIAAIVQ